LTTELKRQTQVKSDNFEDYQDKVTKITLSTKQQIQERILYRDDMAQ